MLQFMNKEKKRLKRVIYTYMRVAVITIEKICNRFVYPLSSDKIILCNNKARVMHSLYRNKIRSVFAF